MMPLTQSREIRVFLSSTFKDMEEERDHLLTQVFPALRRICNERQVSFTEIDLRWGVTEEASRNGRTVEICLEEIDRCRTYPPFFIGFLGERYGWIPQPADLEQFWKARPDSPYAQTIRSALEQGISVTELEMRYGFLANRDAATHARVFLRAPALTEKHYIEAGRPERSDFYDAANGKLSAFKTDLRSAGSVQLDGYASIEAFGEAVYAFMKQELDQLFPANKQLSPAEQRSHSHAIYAASRRKSYVPLPEMRQEVLRAIDVAVSEAGLQSVYSTGINAGSQHIHITGASGLGKSAFAADLECWLPQQRDVWVFAHYTGADGDRSFEGWRDRLLDALEDTGKVISPIPGATKERWDVLPTVLFDVRQALGKPLVLLLDAIDQLSDPNAVALLWQMNLPVGVVLVTTSTPQIGTPEWHIATISPFDETQRRAAAMYFLQEYRKELPSTVIERISADAACAVPLFLRLVLEELRLHASHETLEQLSETLLAAKDAGSLFMQVLQAMDADFAASGHVGLASNAAQLIAASWRGLHQADLARLLADDSDPVDPDDNKPRLPDCLLSPLLSRLEPFCLRDDGRLYIMHAILREPLHKISGLPSVRRELIAHFNNESGAAVAERIYQLWQLHDMDALPRELGNPVTLRTLWEAEPRLLRDVLGTMGAGAASTSPAMEALITCFNAATNSASTLPQDLNNIGVWLVDNSYLSAGETLLRATLEFLRDGTFDRPGVSSALNNLAVLYHAQGRFQEAESLLLEALSIFRRVLPPGHPEIAHRLNNVASLYHAQGRLQEAESLYLEALNIRRQVLPHLHLDIAMSLNNLASLYEAQGRFSAAEPLHQEALGIFRQALPPGHPDIALSLNNVAHLYHIQGRIQETEPLYTEALDIRRRALPPGHPDIANSLNSMASLYQAQGRFQEAESIYLEALDILREALPPGHPDIAPNLTNVASLYCAQSRLQEAEPLYFEALSIRRRALPPGHPDIARSLVNVASVYQEQGRFQEAESHYLEALDIFRRALRPGHPNFMSSLDKVASFYAAQGRLQQAESLYLEALNIRRQVLPHLHPDIAMSLNNVASFYDEQGRLEESEPLYIEALNILRHTLPPGDPDIVVNLYNLAFIYHAMSRLQDAEPLYIEALRIRRQTLPSGHPDIASSVINLANLYREQARFQDAEQLINEMKYSSDHL